MHLAPLVAANPPAQLHRYNDSIRSNTYIIIIKTKTGFSISSL